MFMIIEGKDIHFHDIYELICILEECSFDKEKMYQLYLNHLNRDDYHYYVYLKDDKVVGMLSLLIKETLHHNDLTGEIIELCVHPDFRNQKIGEALLQHVEAYALQHHLIELELSSSMRRIHAHRFYESHKYIKNHYNFTKEIKND